MKITNCARCGENHDIEMQILDNCKDYQAWAICPIKKQPILIKIKNENTYNEMILVEGGTFTMGDTFGDGRSDEFGDGRSDELPVHSVTVSSFYIGKYQVTQKEYYSLIGSNPSYFKGDSLPVEQVSWFDAIKYCNALSIKEGLSIAYNESTGDLLDSSGNITTDVTKVKGYRLPTEAEWEFACKGGNKSKGYKYSGSNNVDKVAWYCENSGGKSHPVGIKKPNELGIYDMGGNVWEWCQDWYDKNYYSKSLSVNPINSSVELYRVLRGGYWNDDGVYVRVAYRFFNMPSDRSNFLGFRLARSI